MFRLRFQYLLVEVGATILRGVFDSRVSNDLMQYLKTKPWLYRQLQFFILNGVITDKQKIFLPPYDTKPTSHNFDITLLIVLLRTVCELRAQNDPVWTTTPRPEDMCMEADISRLRICRNALQHMTTGSMCEADVTAKWNELCQILLRLNAVARIPQFHLLIRNAETIDIDEQLQEHLTTSIQAWEEVDHQLQQTLDLDLQGFGDMLRDVGSVSGIISGIMDEIAGVKMDVSEVNDGVTGVWSEVTQVRSEVDAVRKEVAEIKRNLYGDMDGIQPNYKQLKHPYYASRAEGIRQRLIKIYKEKYRYLPVLSLCEDSDDMVELLSVYQTPSLSPIPYHRVRQNKDNYYLQTYESMFHKNGETFEKVFITGDAGVGKTTLCKRIALLWSMSQSGENVKNGSVQSDINFMGTFDFVFFISLSGHDGYDITYMIVEQLCSFNNRVEQSTQYECVSEILGGLKCLILLDGQDEWTGRGIVETSRLLFVDGCTFVTTCRPYKIETERLSPLDIDRQIHMSGLCKSSTKLYVGELIRELNQIFGRKRNQHDFMRDVTKLGVQELLNLPIFGSHLVRLWYDQPLQGMSQAGIYSKLVDLLLKRAEMKTFIEYNGGNFECGPAAESSGLLKKTCWLSFNLLFKSDKHFSLIEFTSEQLESEPYSLHEREIDSLCKLGILSKNKLIAFFGERNLRLSYLHKNFNPFLAAMYVCRFDEDRAFDEVVNQWNSIDDFIKFETFFVFLAGLSFHQCMCFLERVYSLFSDLNQCRRHAVFHYDCKVYQEKLRVLQQVVVNCFREVCAVNDPNLSCRLEDFIFNKYVNYVKVNDADDNDGYVDDDDVDVFVDANYICLLKQLLVLNKSCVRLICSYNGEYYAEFDLIKTLQCLYVNCGKYEGYDARFTQCMLQNKSSLHCVSIDGRDTLLPEIPLKSLHYLSSLSLCQVRLHHDFYHSLMKVLSRKEKPLIVDIKLHMVQCDTHVSEPYDCLFTVKLSSRKKLTTSLYLSDVDVVCSKVNPSHLKFLTLRPSSGIIASSYSDLLNSIQCSHLEHLEICGQSDRGLDHRTMAALASAVKTLSSVKSLRLMNMKFPHDVQFQLHPDVTQIQVKLARVDTTRKCFKAFLDSFKDNKSMVRVETSCCRIDPVSDENGSFGRPAWDEVMKSVDVMSECIERTPTINITEKSRFWLMFETSSPTSKK